MEYAKEFLPVSVADMEARGWDYYDFLLITGDAYVDHPSFGVSVIGRVLENAGFRVAILPQPDVNNLNTFKALGKPRLAVMLSGGNIDSMVANYTVSKKRRHDDAYSPGGKNLYRPDHAVVAYTKCAKKAYPDLPVIIGGLEASLRRFAHYDYWDDTVHDSILVESGADLLSYGMGEYSMVEIANRLDAGVLISEITDIKGTCFLTDDPSKSPYEFIYCASAEKVKKDKRAYAESTKIQYVQHDPVIGKGIVQAHGDLFLVQNPPQMPLSQDDYDRFAAIPYARTWHPMYADRGGVPAIEEVEFSIIHNRGCFGACNFCSLAFHQGRMVTARSHDSVIDEAKLFTTNPNFKGYIHDVGGPTANFRRSACKKQQKAGLCKDKRCLYPKVCEGVNADHEDYLSLLRKLRSIAGVKKVFIRSGIRYDYMMADKSDEFFRELVKYHVSGQLKVAPEHISERTLYYMGKPNKEVYERFVARFEKYNKEFGLKQFLVPYLMSSHPGCTLEDAIELAEYLNTIGHMPEQVQDFYPTPGTLSTCMYYTGIDPRTMKEVYVPKTAKEKAMQRALLQWRRPQNRALIEEALRTAHREDLIGFDKKCLIRPARAQQPKRPEESEKKTIESMSKPANSSLKNRKAVKSASDNEQKTVRSAGKQSAVKGNKERPVQRGRRK